MSVSRLIARPLLAAGFIYGAQSALRNAEAFATKASPVADAVVPKVRNAGVPLSNNPETLVKINAAVQIAGGLALATGKAPRLGALALSASMVPTTVAGHPFWSESDPAVKKTMQMHFFKNLSMLGGAIIAAGDTDGKPGVAWRARRAAKDARRETKHVTKLAGAKLG
ncbi:DoxX family protein [Nocardioides sp.]|uniref:DoxX family protein n=1 Tax=Nocardioides sp. TaxID=35761 RepID=UPI002B278FC4|nr:DoxX family protein [Nocardioides sp.]